MSAHRFAEGEIVKARPNFLAPRTPSDARPFAWPFYYPARITSLFGDDGVLVEFLEHQASPDAWDQVITPWNREQGFSAKELHALDCACGACDPNEIPARPARPHRPASSRPRRPRHPPRRTHRPHPPRRRFPGSLRLLPAGGLERGTSCCSPSSTSTPPRRSAGTSGSRSATARSSQSPPLAIWSTGPPSPRRSATRARPRSTRATPRPRPLRADPAGAGRAQLPRRPRTRRGCGRPHRSRNGGRSWPVTSTARCPGAAGPSSSTSAARAPTPTQHHRRPKLSGIPHALVRGPRVGVHGRPRRRRRLGDHHPPRPAEDRDRRKAGPDMT